MRSKLLSPKDLFATEDFAEVLSPLVEPADEEASIEIQKQLIELGFKSERPTSLVKLQVLLSSFLMQSSRLLSRSERKSEPMVIGIPHDEVYWRKRSKVGYKVAKRLCAAFFKSLYCKFRFGHALNLNNCGFQCNLRIRAEMRLEEPKMHRNFRAQLQRAVRNIYPHR